MSRDNLISSELLIRVTSLRRHKSVYKRTELDLERLSPRYLSLHILQSRKFESHLKSNLYLIDERGRLFWESCDLHYLRLFSQMRCGRIWCLQLRNQTRKWTTPSAQINHLALFMGVKSTSSADVYFSIELHPCEMSFKRKFWHICTHEHDMFNKQTCKCNNSRETG